MKKLRSKAIPLLSAFMLVLAMPLAAEETAKSASTEAAMQTISPEAQAVVDKMTAYLRTLKAFSIEARSTRDEVVAFGYKLQRNEHAILTVQLPNKLRAEVTGDLRNRTAVYDGSKFVLYSADDDVYSHINAPNTVRELVDNLLDAGVELPVVDVLYQAGEGTLTADVRGGVLVGESNIDGADCDQLAFRQQSLDWQLWVEKGDKPLPRKLLITTRYAVGDPQFQATMRWNLNPKIDASTFVFTPPKGTHEIPFRNPSAVTGPAP